MRKGIDPPYMPRLEGTNDLSNIDKAFTREAPRETPEDEDRILKKAKFDDFTFVESEGSKYLEIN